MLTNQHMKDSGIAYIGSIPADWDMFRASMLFRENKQTNNDLSSTTPVQFKFGEIIEKPIDVDDKVKEEIKRYIVVNQDDIMVNGLNLNYDFLTQRVAIVQRPGCITPAYISMSARSKILPMYACYLLKALDGRKVLNGWGTGIRLTLNFSEFKKYYLPVPSKETQKIIVGYLDKETRKIDDLIMKQENLLKLLEEKRRATITHAVRPASGTTEQRFRDICMLNPATELSFKDDDIVGFYPMELIGDDGTIDHSQKRPYSAVKTGYTIFQNGDVTVAKVTPCFENYKGAHMVGIASGVGFGTTELLVLRANEKVTPEYLYWLTQAQDLNNYLAGGMRGTGGLKRVVPEELKNYKLNIPAPETQKRIVSRLVEDLKKFELLKQKAVQQIELLKERRISLISNVVTGKVKI